MDRDTPIAAAPLADATAGTTDVDKASPSTAGGRLAAQLSMTGDRVPTTDSSEPLVDGHRFLTIAAVEQESELVTSYWLASPDGTGLPTATAGQYLPIAVDVPGYGVLRRAYTISAYEAGRYRLSIKRERLPGRPPGRVSNYVHDHWAVGDLVNVGVPEGYFVLETTSGRPIVLLAGGIGMTPLLAMLRELAVREPSRRVVLIMGMRHPFQSEVAGLVCRMPNLTIHVRYSEDADEGQAPDSYGLVDEALLRDLLPLLDADVYLCGPAPFMNAMDQALAARGVPDEHVRFETFGPATIERCRKQASAATSDFGPIVNFARSNLTAPFDPHALSLLEFSEDLGLNPPFNCRSGSCGACATRRLSGAIQYVEVPSADVADNDVLHCCALPDGPVSLDL